MKSAIIGIEAIFRFLFDFSANDSLTTRNDPNISIIPRNQNQIKNLTTHKIAAKLFGSTITSDLWIL